MESSLVNAFRDTLSGIMKRCVGDMEAEAQKFMTVVQALHKIQPIQSSQQTGPNLQDRIDRLQTSMGLVAEDLDELNERVNKLSRIQQKEDADNCGPWIYTPNEYLSGSDVNELVSDGIPDLIDDDIVMMPVISTATAATATTAVVTAVTATASESEQSAGPAGSVPDVSPVEDEETTDEEESATEEELELEELEFNGTLYMKDPEENVYSVNKDGEVDDTPVGRWVEKKKAIKFYSGRT